jgi:thiol-disulfide isomerase/thioredoxin
MTRTRTIVAASLILLGLVAAGTIGLLAADKKEDAQAASTKDASADAKAEAKLSYELPKGGVDELLAFIKKIREFEPASQDELDELQEKGIPALKAACEKIVKIAKPEDKNLPGYEDATRLLLVIRATEAVKASPAEQRKLVNDVKVHIASHATPTPHDAALAVEVTRMFDAADDPEVAALAYRELGGLLAKSKDEQMAMIGAKMEGAARRITLVGKPMEVTGTQLDGAKFDWAKYRGKVVLIDFWATWCGPCRAEVPNVKKNYREYHDRGFDVVGINLDDEREDVEKYLEKEKYPWVTLYDGGWDANAMATHYGVMGIPTVILVNKDGNVVSTEARGPELGKLLEQLLGPPAPAADDAASDDK